MDLSIQSESCSYTNLPTKDGILAMFTHLTSNNIFSYLSWHDILSIATTSGIYYFALHTSILKEWPSQSLLIQQQKDSRLVSTHLNGSLFYKCKNPFLKIQHLLRFVPCLGTVTFSNCCFSAWCFPNLVASYAIQKFYLNKVNIIDIKSFCQLLECQLQSITSFHLKSICRGPYNYEMMHQFWRYIAQMKELLSLFLLTMLALYAHHCQVLIS